MDTENIKISKIKNNILVEFINKPLNLFSLNDVDCIYQFVKKHSNDNVKSIIFTGGNRIFSAGIQKNQDSNLILREIDKLWEFLDYLGIKSISIVAGFAAGFGLYILLKSTIKIGSDSSKYNFVEVEYNENFFIKNYNVNNNLQLNKEVIQTLENDKTFTAKKFKELNILDKLIKVEQLNSEVKNWIK